MQRPTPGRVEKLLGIGEGGGIPTIKTKPVAPKKPDLAGITEEAVDQLARERGWRSIRNRPNYEKVAIEAEKQALVDMQNSINKRTPQTREWIQAKTKKFPEGGTVTQLQRSRRGRTVFEQRASGGGSFGTSTHKFVERRSRQLMTHVHEMEKAAKVRAAEKLKAAKIAQRERIAKGKKGCK
jgi:hypothetical protein